MPEHVRMQVAFEATGMVLRQVCVIRLPNAFDQIIHGSHGHATSPFLISRGFWLGDTAGPQKEGLGGLACFDEGSGVGGTLALQVIGQGRAGISRKPEGAHGFALAMDMNKPGPGCLPYPFWGVCLHLP